MSILKKSVLGVEVSTSTKGELLKEVSGHLESTSKTPLTIVTPNPEQMVYAQKDEQFRQILNSADIALPDGVGIRLSTGIKRIAGIDFAEDLLKIAADKGYQVGFIGGRNNTAEVALDKLQKKYPGLAGWAEDGLEISSKQLVVSSKETTQGTLATSYSLLTTSSEMKEYLELLIKKIQKTQTRILFVGLGAPKQEYFIEAISHQLSAFRQNIVLMVVGGTFDVWSGRIRRAPVLVRGLGLEWLWRLVQEPWRIKRQIQLLRFVYLILKVKTKR